MTEPAPPPEPNLNTLTVTKPFLLNTNMAKSCSRSFRVSDEEVSQMIQRFLEKKRWTLEFLAAVLDIQYERLLAIYTLAHKPSPSERRLIWMFWAADVQPACLSLPTYFVTWGKVDCIREEAPSAGHSSKWKGTGYFDPFSVWMNVDWSFQNRHIANMFAVPIEEVRAARKFLSAQAFPELQNYWRRCDKNPAWVCALKRADYWWLPLTRAQRRVIRTPFEGFAPDNLPKVRANSSSISR